MPGNNWMKLLVVDDDETLRLMVKLTLEPKGYTVGEACDGLEAVEKIASGGGYQFVLLDVNMPGMDGLKALEKIKEISPEVICLILTAHSDVKDAVRAIKAGAWDYLEKPVSAEQLTEMLASAGEANALVEAVALSAPAVHFDEGRSMIGGSSEIRKVYDIIYKLAKVDTAVLIRGESGTGKELVARALHFNSHRKKGPFVGVNCAAIPENLVESELFGHEKGAFTGADKKKIGKFQFAAGGTLFLDEIGDISQNMQVKLLRVLQEKSFTPVGGNAEIKADVRIIAATHKPLEQMIEDYSFRADLFYRLNVLPIVLPPLRERVGDIRPLIDFMIRKFNGEHSRNVSGLEPACLEALMNYHWPGNIRELENVIEHSFIMENSDILALTSLPGHVSAYLQAGNDLGASNPGENSEERQEYGVVGMIPDVSELNYPMLKEQFEREFLIKALQAFSGKVNQTAVHTKMTKVTLLRKLEKYGINPREYRR